MMMTCTPKSVARPNPQFATSALHEKASIKVQSDRSSDWFNFGSKYNFVGCLAGKVENFVSKVGSDLGVKN
jgi:hypothetical protein